MEDILESSGLSDDEQKSYKTVRGKLESYLAKKRNWISFFQRRQEEGEPVASFVNDVYTLTKHCNFDALHDEMVRDILVAGIRNKRLLARLQVVGDLILDKAVTCIWYSEMVHQEQFFLCGDDTRQFPTDAMKTSRRPAKNKSDTS